MQRKTFTRTLLAAWLPCAVITATGSRRRKP